MNIYEIMADTRNEYLELDAFERLDRGRYLRDNKRIDENTLRRTWVGLRLRRRRTRGGANNAQDIYPVGYYAGINFVVSDAFRRQADACFPGACIFLPVDLAGSVQDFWAMWVVKEADELLDQNASEWVVGPGGLRHIKAAKFRSGVTPPAIFRLSRLYSGLEDLVAEEFVSAISAAAFAGVSYRKVAS